MAYAAPLSPSLAATSRSSSPLSSSSPSSSSSSSLSYGSSLSSIAYVVRPELDPLEREKREVERRRQRQEDRTARILHAKTRIIGIDVEALNDQIAEKQEREKLELERNAHYDQQTLAHARAISLASSSRLESERRSAESLNAFRRQQIAEKQARDRIHDSRWTDLAAQSQSSGSTSRFLGEDPEASERVKAQKQQQEAWLNEQLAGQREKEEKERKAEAEYVLYQRKINDMQNKAAEERERQKKEEAAKLAEYNRQLAQQKENDKRRTRASNQAKDDEEIASSLSSSLLLESVGGSLYGSHRTLPSQFKGFSVAHRQSVLDGQLAQQQEARLRRERERQEEKEEAQQQEAIRRELLMREREKARKEKEKQEAIRDERIVQAKQKLVKTHYLNNVVYTNPVGDEYFAQFGTSCR